LEEVIYFSLGFFFSSFFRPTGDYLKKPDRILRWDSSVFAWRPVLHGSAVNEDETVLFAYEMKKTDIRFSDEER
jgi:hypothetical protein